MNIDVKAEPQANGDVRVLVDCGGRTAALLFAADGVFAEIPQVPAAAQ